MESGSMDPLTVADREDALAGWLEEHGVERSWLIAPPLAAAGLDIEWCERVAALLGDAPLGAGLEWVASSLSTATLLSEVKESTRRISDLVAAVKSYSQLDRASIQQMDLAEGIESTLVMLAHKMKDGITVVRDYGDNVPRIEAIAGELNQVWTNLIDNAIDAMDGTGHAPCVDPRRRERRGRGGRRHRPRDSQGSAGSRFRSLLHHQGSREGNRLGPRYLAAHHRRPARRRDHDRAAAGRDGAASTPSASPPAPVLTPSP